MKTEVEAVRQTHDGVKQLKLKGLQQLNILFGKNGSGKSSFLRNLYQSGAEIYHLVLPERGGDIVYGSSYADQELHPQEKKNARTTSSDNNYRNRAISRAANILNTQGYKAIKGLQANDINSEEITNLFRTFLPEFKVNFGSDPPHQLEIHRSINNQDTKVNGVNELSSGQAEALSLAADIITQGVLWSKQEKTLLIDEPDAHLHIDLQNRFAIFISEIIGNFDIQIVIATHSPALIASLLSLSEDVGIFCFDPDDSEITAVKKDQNAVFSNLLNVDLGLAVILKRKIIIVEGNDDFLVWNQACRVPNFKDASIIQANGSDIYKYKSNAEKILKVILDIREVVGITVLDGDDKGDAVNNKGSQLPFARLQCYGLENLILTNEVLGYIKQGIDINAELAEMKKTAITEEKGVLDALMKDKKSTKIPKDLIKKIHSRIDEHNTSRDWRVVLGKFMGNSKPEGELAEFLGKEIVDYVWGDV
ncbi:hypothetical protein A3D14_00795 [Candidatus Saccharibacteria bacterium RIFCSPHIGHO2_02_FULL_47_12]|nr:MAG: hypothetical protein A3D14_00795 [Candidatus Saccharibacteria bacterium RIFCSPHIGHO2_02_FULL_47_12]